MTLAKDAGFASFMLLSLPARHLSSQLPVSPATRMDGIASLSTGLHELFLLPGRAPLSAEKFTEDRDVPDFVYEQPWDGEETNGSTEQKLGTVGKKRLKQLRRKPGWYRRRSAHISRRMRKNMHQFAELYCLKTPQWGTALNIPASFDNIPGCDRIILDVGFGTGDTIVEFGRRLEEKAVVLGVEWHKASLAHGIVKLNEAGMTEKRNVRILRGDIVRYLESGWLAPHSLDEVCVFFPDPWPHEKDALRRVINPSSIRLLGEAIKPGGYLHIATDVREYAAWTGQIMAETELAWSACPKPPSDSLLVNSNHSLAAPGPATVAAALSLPERVDEQEHPAAELSVEALAEYKHNAEILQCVYGLQERRPTWRPVTMYERKGILGLKHEIYDLCYRRPSPIEAMRQSSHKRTN